MVYHVVDIHTTRYYDDIHTTIITLTWNITTYLDVTSAGLFIDGGAAFGAERGVIRSFLKSAFVRADIL